MKKLLGTLFWAAMLLLCLCVFLILLASCGRGVQTSPPPETVPSQEIIDKLNEKYGLDPTPEPPTPKEQLLKFVDEVLAGDKLCLQCFLSNGSGPCTVDLEGFEEEVRALFEGQNWTSIGGVSNAEQTPADWTAYLNAGTGNLNLSLTTRHDALQVYYYDKQGDSQTLLFLGEKAHQLPHQLADLHDGPAIRYMLTEVPAEGIKDVEELAQAFAKAFEELYLASGAITNFDLADVIPLPTEGESSSQPIRLTYTVTPARPDHPFWAEAKADISKGNYTFTNDLSLCLDGDNVWRCDWILA